MSDHVKTLKRWINDPREGEEYRIAVAIRAALEENEREKFNREQYKIRVLQLEARIEAALADCKLVRTWADDPDPLHTYEEGVKDAADVIEKVLRGEK